MLDVIPAIDLLGGACVRLHQGDYDQVETFGDDPIAMAQHWHAQGAQRLHLVDLDAARTGDPTNYPLIRHIVAALPIPVQVGGGVRSAQTAAQLLDMGVERVIVGTLAVEDPDQVASLCQAHPQQIVIGIDARQGLVATRGWRETATLRATDLATQVSAMGAAAIIYTDILRDGTLKGPNLEQLRAVQAASHIPVIASGGIGSLSDILSLLQLSDLAGVIVGKAIYSGAVNLKEALRAVSQGRWQDVTGQTWA